jgi:hypothetical protein
MNCSLTFSKMLMGIVHVTPAEKQVEWDYLIEKCEADVKWEKIEQEKACKAFMARVADLVKCGAGNEATALRWIAESYGCDSMYANTRDEIEYNCGLPWGWLYEYYPDVWADHASIEERRAAA